MLPSVCIPRIPIHVCLRFPDIGIHRLQLIFICGPHRRGTGGNCTQKLLIFLARLGFYRRSCGRSYYVRLLGRLLCQLLRSRGRHGSGGNRRGLCNRRGRWSRGRNLSSRSLLLRHLRGWLMAYHVRACHQQRSRNRRQPPCAPSPSWRSWDKDGPGGRGLGFTDRRVRDQPFGA